MGIGWEGMHRMLYVGVDAHKRMSQLTVMDSSGTVVDRQRVPSTQAGIHDALGGYEEPMKSVVEASYCWAPMYDWLTEIGDDVVLAHPSKVRAIADARIKTDKIDADTLAHLLRADLIPAAYAPGKETRATKRVLRQRMFLVRVRTMVKNRVQALLSQHSIERPDLSDLFGRAGLRWMESLELPEPDGSLLREQLALLGQLQERIRSSEGMLRDLSKGDEAVQWLRSLPGIGTFYSVLIRYEVDDIRRFREAKKFASYTGLIPSTYASGDRVRHGRLTKQGNKWLRWAFVEAVTPAITSSPWLRRYYERIKKRRGSKDARVATARKLAELTWTIWTEERAYEERA